ncbi:Hypothetical Protein FCC1311_034822 [Hondaea fermentalgiana]|uniref:Uncharacterized protein n=1 Tax=Hondaea fermentalgiana TaxID=2315210 RepID=A0A2R5G8D7_9STRA|nr:Hypothetical Protein FCC1311_034822 [Hondaea fermentalgiana]|eukprot:GBG27260.1 Hypothetical Protein FCC1311_034822 [Hondaea fermentalgiana]
MSYFRRLNQPKELLIPSSFDVTAAFRFANTGSRRTAYQFNLGSSVVLRRQLSAIFDPDDRPPLTGHSARQLAKIAIAVGLLSQTMINLAEVAVEKGHPRAKWSGTAEIAFEALKNNTPWPVNAFWPRLGLAQEESSPSTSLAAPTADAGTSRSKGLGKPFPEFVFEAEPDWLKEHHVFDRIAAGELGVVKDHDEILSELQYTMARDKALHDLKDQLHPLAKRAIDRKRLLLSKADVAPNLVREALERFSEALYKSKASDEAFVERLRRFDFLRAARLAVDDWIVLLLPTRDERLAWMKADCNSIDFDKIVTYCRYTDSVNQIADPRRDDSIFRDRTGFSIYGPILWTETRKKIMDAVERLNLVRECFEETHFGSEKLSFDEVTNNFQIRHFTTGLKLHLGLHGTSEAERIRKWIRQLRDLVAQRKACDVAELNKGICYVKRREAIRTTVARMNSRAQPRRLAAARGSVEREQKTRAASVFIGKKQHSVQASALPVDTRGEFMFSKTEEVAESPRSKEQRAADEDDLLHL